MKITCQSCGKQYDTDRDELCPRCGSYNSFARGYDDAEKLDGTAPTTISKNIAK